MTYNHMTTTYSHMNMTYKPTFHLLHYKFICSTLHREVHLVHSSMSEHHPDAGFYKLTVTNCTRNNVSPVYLPNYFNAQQKLSVYTQSAPM